MKTVGLFGLVLCLGLAAPFCRGEEPDAPAVVEPAPQFTQAQLDVLLGPIALYPDPLLAIILPAATQPGDIVLAVRYLNAGGDPEQIDAQPWNESARALARYQEVIRWMDENLQWTTQLGQAYLVQPEDVMNTIQRLRELARSYGNLTSNAQTTVEVEDGNIDILPANPEIIYVPVYVPEIIYTQPAPFGQTIYYNSSLQVGHWVNRDWDWPNRRVVIWNRDCARPHDWWKKPRSERSQTIETSKLNDWRPQGRPVHNQSQYWSRPAMAQKTASMTPTNSAPSQNHPKPAPSTGGARIQSSMRSQTTKK